MRNLKRDTQIYVSSMQGPDSSWTLDYDVAERMNECENFWLAGQTPALYDALTHVKDSYTLTFPAWIIEGALKVVEDRLRTGFATNNRRGKKSDERKIYQSEIAAYYRWREVWKAHLAGDTLGAAYEKASDSLASTDFKGEPETMRKAYQRVSKDLKYPARAFRYYSAMPSTRLITGTSLKKKRGE